MILLGIVGYLGLFAALGAGLLTFYALLSELIAWSGRRRRARHAARRGGVIELDVWRARAGRERKRPG